MSAVPSVFDQFQCRSKVKALANLVLKPRRAVSVTSLSLAN